MSLLVLDTDHVSLVLRGHPQVTARLQVLDFQQWAVTVVSIQEIFNGWVVNLNNPRFKDR
jgi:tRNA(fMet)-specific endonuclease VapC